MNSSNITIWYETGCPEEIHLPDPGLFDLGGIDGYYAQREYIDVANPDEGIFLCRYYVPLGGEDPDGATTGEEGPWRLLAPRDRTRIVAPSELRCALLVICHGIAVLRREPGSRFACGLSPVAAGDLGFGNAARDGDPAWIAEALRAMIGRLLALGPAGERAVEEAYRGAVGREARTGGPGGAPA